jgi:hypothetical protein
MSLSSGRLHADAYKEPRTGIEFPEAVGSFKRGDVKPYEVETNKSGVLIQYSSKDAEATIFVRALGNEGHKTSADFLEETFAGVKALEAKGQYSKVKTYSSNAGTEKPGWKSGAFTSSSTNGFLASFIYCKVIPGYLVKIRASTGTSKLDGLHSFATSIQEVVDSTVKKP